MGFFSVSTVVNYMATKKINKIELSEPLLGVIMSLYAIKGRELSGSRAYQKCADMAIKSPYWNFLKKTLSDYESVRYAVAIGLFTLRQKNTNLPEDSTELMSWVQEKAVNGSEDEKSLIRESFRALGYTINDAADNYDYETENLIARRRGRRSRYFQLFFEGKCYANLSTFHIEKNAPPGKRLWYDYLTRDYSSALSIMVAEVITKNKKLESKSRLEPDDKIYTEVRDDKIYTEVRQKMISLCPQKSQTMLKDNLFNNRLRAVYKEMQKKDFEAISKLAKQENKIMKLLEEKPECKKPSLKKMLAEYSDEAIEKSLMSLATEKKQKRLAAQRSSVINRGSLRFYLPIERKTQNGIKKDLEKAVNENSEEIALYLIDKLGANPSLSLIKEAVLSGSVRVAKALLDKKEGDLKQSEFEQLLRIIMENIYVQRNVDVSMLKMFIDKINSYRESYSYHVDMGFFNLQQMGNDGWPQKPHIMKCILSAGNIQVKLSKKGKLDNLISGDSLEMGRPYFYLLDAMGSPLLNWGPIQAYLGRDDSSEIEPPWKILFKNWSEKDKFEKAKNFLFEYSSLTYGRYALKSVMGRELCEKMMDDYMLSMGRPFPIKTEVGNINSSYACLNPIVRALSQETRKYMDKSSYRTFMERRFSTLEEQAALSTKYRPIMLASRIFNNDFEEEAFKPDEKLDPQSYNAYVRGVDPNCEAIIALSENSEELKGKILEMLSTKIKITSISDSDNLSEVCDPGVVEKACEILDMYNEVGEDLEPFSNLGQLVDRYIKGDGLEHQHLLHLESDCFDLSSSIRTCYQNGYDLKTRFTPLDTEKHGPSLWKCMKNDDSTSEKKLKWIKQMFLIPMLSNPMLSNDNRKVFKAINTLLSGKKDNFDPHIITKYLSETTYPSWYVDMLFQEVLLPLYNYKCEAHYFLDEDLPIVYSGLPEDFQSKKLIEKAFSMGGETFKQDDFLIPISEALEKGEKVENIRTLLIEPFVHNFKLDSLPRGLSVEIMDMIAKVLIDKGKKDELTQIIGYVVEHIDDALKLSALSKIASKIGNKQGYESVKATLARHMIVAPGNPTAPLKAMYTANQDLGLQKLKSYLEGEFEVDIAIAMGLEYQEDHEFTTNQYRLLLEQKKLEGTLFENGKQENNFVEAARLFNDKKLRSVGGENMLFYAKILPEFKKLSQSPDVAGAMQVIVDHFTKSSNAGDFTEQMNDCFGFLASQLKQNEPNIDLNKIAKFLMNICIDRGINVDKAILEVFPVYKDIQILETIKKTGIANVSLDDLCTLISNTKGRDQKLTTIKYVLELMEEQGDIEALKKRVGLASIILQASVSPFAHMLKWFPEEMRDKDDNLRKGEELMKRMKEVVEDRLHVDLEIALGKVEKIDPKNLTPNQFRLLLECNEYEYIKKHIDDIKDKPELWTEANQYTSEDLPIYKRLPNVYYLAHEKFKYESKFLFLLDKDLSEREASAKVAIQSIDRAFPGDEAEQDKQLEHMFLFNYFVSKPSETMHEIGNMVFLFNCFVSKPSETTHETENLGDIELLAMDKIKNLGDIERLAMHKIENLRETELLAIVESIKQSILNTFPEDRVEQKKQFNDILLFIQTKIEEIMKKDCDNSMPKDIKSFDSIIVKLSEIMESQNYEKDDKLKEIQQGATERFNQGNYRCYGVFRLGMKARSGDVCNKTPGSGFKK